MVNEKTIVDKYDKSNMQDLPRVLFPGRIKVIVNERDAIRAVKFLTKQTLLGFDTETRPSFSKGKMYKVALLQVCCLAPAPKSSAKEEGGICFLFRLNRIDLPDCLIKLLEDTTITKVGLSLRDDLRALEQRKSFKSGTFIDLQDTAKQMGIADGSLQKLYANIFGQRISKGQQLSNWEADDLSEAQKLYAATDAWACVMLYKEMTRMQKEGYQLEVRKEDPAKAPSDPPL